MPTPDEDDLRELEDRRYGALVGGRLQDFERLCHPELVYTHSTGATDTLESYLEKCRGGFYVYHRVDHPIERIAVVGDVGLVVGEMHADVDAGGARKSLHSKVLAVWVRAGTDWRLLAHQGTPLT